MISSTSSLGFEFCRCMRGKIPTEISKCVHNLGKEDKTSRIFKKLHHIRCTELKLILCGAHYIINTSNYVNTKCAQSCVSTHHLFEVTVKIISDNNTISGLLSKATTFILIPHVCCDQRDKCVSDHLMSYVLDFEFPS